MDSRDNYRALQLSAGTGSLSATAPQHSVKPLPFHPLQRLLQSRHTLPPSQQPSVPWAHALHCCMCSILLVLMGQIAPCKRGPAPRRPFAGASPVP
jgi:hypothetical protein